MDKAVTIVALVIATPIIGGCAIAIVAIARGWWLKARDLKIREQHLRIEEKLRTDEMNAKILRMDDGVLSESRLASLEEEVRRLREEIAQLKQNQFRA